MSNHQGVTNFSNEIITFRKAVSCNNKESLEKLLSNMKGLNQSELNNALFLCIENFRVEEQSEECLFLLLRNKANPNCEINGQTPLIAACKAAQLILVKSLIDNGAKPDLCNSEGIHPLTYLLKCKRQNYDVAEYLISSMSHVNIEIAKTYPLLIAIENQFFRIFKILIDKGATLVFNDENVLHIIVKKKFKDLKKKKKFLQKLSNRYWLSTVKDKNAKLPIQYQTEDQIKNYFHQIFKPKGKLIEKQINSHKIREKQLLLRQSQKEKELKKQKKEEEVSIEYEEALDEEDNEDNGQNHQDDKSKIFQVIQEEEEQKKNQDQKYKKNVKPTLANNSGLIAKKHIKNINTKINQKDINTKINQKQKISKKIILDSKKKSQPNLNKKVNKSFTCLKKDISQEKQEIKRKYPLKSISKDEENRKEKALSSTSSQGTNKKDKNDDSKILVGSLKMDENVLKIQTKIIEEDSKSVEMEQEDKQNVEKVVERQKLLDLKRRYEIICENIEVQSSSQEQTKQQEEVFNEARLTQEIFTYLESCEKENNIIEEEMMKAIYFLQNKMKLCLETHVQKPFSFRVQVYGSRATGLAIQKSDVDLLVISTLHSDELMTLFDQYHIFVKEEEEIQDVKILKNASMPIIKICLNSNFNNLKVDLTFQIRGHSGIRCAQLIKEFIGSEPLLKPLVIMLKNMIYRYGLSDPYTGGLGSFICYSVGSYSLTLMIIALLQFTEIEKKKQMVGKLFLQFLLFYGFQLDYVCQAIIIHPPGFAFKPVYSIYQLPNTLDLTPKLVIYDPLNPVNNVGRTTYRIECLKKLFQVAYIRLRSSSITIHQIIDESFQEIILENHDFKI